MHDIHYAGHSFPQDIETYDGCEIHDAVGIAYHAILFFPTMYIIECTRRYYGIVFGIFSTAYDARNACMIRNAHGTRNTTAGIDRILCFAGFAGCICIFD